MIKNKINNEKGFTIVELVVLICVLAGCTIVSTATFATVRDKQIQVNKIVELKKVDGVEDFDEKLKLFDMHLLIVKEEVKSNKYKNDSKLISERIFEIGDKIGFPRTHITTTINKDKNIDITLYKEMDLLRIEQDLIEGNRLTSTNTRVIRELIINN